MKQNIVIVKRNDDELKWLTDEIRECFQPIYIGGEASQDEDSEGGSQDEDSEGGSQDEDDNNSESSGSGN